MHVKTLTIACDLLQRSGRHPSEGVPFRALESWVQSLRAQIPDDEEPTCVVLGTEALTATYEHRLSNEEVQAEQIAELRKAKEDAQAILANPLLTHEQRIKALVDLLGV